MAEQGLPSDAAGHAGSDFGSGTIKLPCVTIPVPKTFTLIDRLLAFPLENWLQNLDRKRQNNIERHVEVVGEKARVANDNFVAEPKIETIRLLEKWAERGGDYGDEEPDMAAAWRAALEKIRNGDSEADAILLAITSLSASDLKYLLNAFKRMHLYSRQNKILERFRIARLLTRKGGATVIQLERTGILYNDFSNKVALTILIVAAIVILPAAYIYVFYTSYYRVTDAQMLWWMGPITFSTATTGLLILLTQYQMRYKLTSVGSKLADSFLRYTSPPSL